MSAAVVACAALAGCGGDQTASAKKPAASKSAVPKDGGSYDTPDDVITAMGDAGIPCSAPSPVADPTNANADTRCSADGEEIVVRTYDSHDLAQQQAQLEMDLMAGVSGVNIVVGVDWTVSGPPSFAERVHTKLGGSLVQQD